MYFDEIVKKYISDKRKVARTGKPHVCSDVLEQTQ
jgi:hypothetical protein